jgi:hypothetical protein
MTWIDQGMKPPFSGSGLYCAKPGEPFACTGTRRPLAHGAPIVDMKP